MIIESTEEKNKVIFGSTVDLEDLTNKGKTTYKIVGEDEADYSENKISYNSPIGKGLIGKEINDEVIISLPKGDLKFKIIKIK